MSEHPVWRGHLRLALVSCPVALFTARRGGGGLHFHFLNPETGNRVRMITQDAETGEELSRGDLVKGYEFRKNQYVVMTSEDFDSARVESSSTLNVEKFIPADSLDPIYIDNTYYMLPDGDAGQDVYLVLREAIAKSGRMALSRLVIAQRERAVAIAALGRGLVVRTLHEAADLVNADEVFQAVPSDPTDADMVKLATQLIDRQTGRYDPADTQDRYEARLREVIDAKVKGEGLQPEAEDEPDDQTNVVDLMAALKRSLGQDSGKPAAKPAAKPRKPAAKAPPARRADLLAGLGELVPSLQARAEALDAEAAFPAEDVADLRRIGALAAPVPADLGGLGLGTDPDGAAALLDLLRLIGRGNLAVGRVYEGHVNALRLVMRFGTPAQRQRAADDARAGHLFAIWVTDDPRDPLRAAGGVLSGTKGICSAAGHATRPVVTVDTGGDQLRMALLPLDGREQVRPSSMHVQGMRAARSLPVGFDGLPIAPDDLVGEPGDYLREPDFSAGAWRTAAVTLGGLEALVDLAAAHLVARGRDADPHQRARMGQALMARETAGLWLRKAAVLGDSLTADPADAVAYVDLARLAVEAATLDAIRLVQRSLGLAAFRRPDPVERICRDLATYLRQPAPDEALTNAAAHFMRASLPAAA